MLKNKTDLKNTQPDGFSKNLRVAIIGAAGVPACYGGFESLVDNLLDFTPPNVLHTVFCSAKKYSERRKTYKGADLVYLEKDANGKESIFYDFESMRRAIKSPVNADILLVLGVSGCVFLPFVRRAFKGKIITNIDGLEWRRGKWNFLVKKFLKFSEKMAVKYSDVIISDNKGISDYVKSEYKKDSELIAYGGDQASSVMDPSLFEKYPFLKNNDGFSLQKDKDAEFVPYSITVCRIEVENNIHIILEAFSNLPDCTLVVAGNWEKSEYGRALKEKYSVFKNLHLLNPVYESHEVNFLRSNASLYIHGHSAGGTNPSLVEAMNLALPVLAFDCVYNRAATEEKCLYWKNSFELKNAAAELLKDGSKRRKIACEMLETGKRLYSWQKIAEKYNALFK